MCRYHKKHLGNAELCAKILARSHRDTEEEYQERSNRETYGDGRSKFEQFIFDDLYKTKAEEREKQKEAT